MTTRYCLGQASQLPFPEIEQDVAGCMDRKAEITGQRLRLRLVRPEDAAFIHVLRTDPAYNCHLSPVIGTVEYQRAWIAACKVHHVGDNVRATS